MSKTDIQLTCVKCQRIFTWSAGEQNFLNSLVAQSKLPEVIQPKRCLDCREKRKQRSFER